MKRWIKLLSDENGSSQTLEFALSALVFFSLILSIIDISRAMCAYHFTTYWSEQGARYAVVRGAKWSSGCNTSAPPSFTMSYGCIASASDVENYVRALPGLNRSNLSVSTSWPGTTPDCTSSCSACSGSNSAKSQGCQVNVTVTYNFKFFTPLILKSGLNFTATSTKVIQY